MKKRTRKQKEGRAAARYSSAEASRLNVYAGDREGQRAIAWAQKSWRTAVNVDGTQPKSASTFLLDLLKRAMRADERRPRRK